MLIQPNLPPPHQQLQGQPNLSTTTTKLGLCDITTPSALLKLHAPPTPIISLETALYLQEKKNGVDVAADNIIASAEKVIRVENDDSSDVLAVNNDCDLFNIYGGRAINDSEHHPHLPRSPTIRPESTALVIVDVQPEYWSESPSIQLEFPKFPENIGRTIRTCRSNNIKKIIWIRANYRYKHSPWLFQYRELRLDAQDTQFEIEYDPNCLKWEDFAMPIQYQQQQRKEGMDDDDEGNDNDEGDTTEIVIPKTSWCGTRDTPLLKILEENGIQTVLLCGLLTSVCVQYTAFGIFEAGYETFVVEDACGDRGMDRHNAALMLYGDYMYKTITSTELEETIMSQQRQKQEQQQVEEEEKKEDDDVILNATEAWIESNMRDYYLKDGNIQPSWTTTTTTTAIGVGGGGHHRPRRSFVSPFPHSGTSTSCSRARSLAF